MTGCANDLRREWKRRGEEKSGKQSERSSGKDKMWQEKVNAATTRGGKWNKGIRVEVFKCCTPCPLSQLLLWLCRFPSSEAPPFINAPLIAPCPTLFSFHLCILLLVFLPHATFSTHHCTLILCSPGLLWSIQSCNHWPCPSTILSFLFSPDSLSLSLPKGSQESPNPLFSHFLCLSTYPSVLYLSLAPCVFL